MANVTHTQSQLTDLVQLGAMETDGNTKLAGHCGNVENVGRSENGIKMEQNATET